ncbi:MAG: hypothetical protein K6F49_02350 [Saccharofermentans sp.]|nr:hypothetical protein [Saccharofermentans sp.]
MNTRRIFTLVMNMASSGMTLLMSGIVGLIFLIAAISYGALGAFALLSFAIFGAIVTLVILSIIHFVRHTKGQYNSFDKYSIALGTLNFVGYIAITILYVIGITYGSAGRDYTIFSIVSAFALVGVCILFSIIAVVLSIISLRKEAAQYPNA